MMDLATYSFIDHHRFHEPCTFLEIHELDNGRWIWLYCSIITKDRINTCNPIYRIPIGFFLVEIQGAEPCWEGIHMLHGCVKWTPILRIQNDLPWWWPDRGRGSTTARWMRWHTAPAYAPHPWPVYKLVISWAYRTDNKAMRLAAKWILFDLSDHTVLWQFY